jgi:hypothetical protein
MTEQTRDPAGNAGVSTPAQADPSASILITLDCLHVAAQAARLAIDIARDAEQTTREAHLASADISRNWRSTNLLAQTAFEQLHARVLDIDAIIQSIRSQR